MIWMGPFAFLDQYWKNNKDIALEIARLGDLLSPSELGELVIDLNLHVTRNNYYEVPPSIDFSDFKAAWSSACWPRVPEKLPKTRVNNSRRINPKFKTVYEYEDFLFIDVRYSKSTTNANTYELEKNDSIRIFNVIKQMKQVSYKTMRQYLLQHREEFPYRNGKIVFSNNVEADRFEMLSMSPKRTFQPNTQKKTFSKVSSQIQNPELNQVSNHNMIISRPNVDLSTSTPRLATPRTELVNPHQDQAFRRSDERIEKRTSRLRSMPKGKLVPARISNKITRIVRMTAPVNYLKKLYAETCQICGTILDLGFGEAYSEVHHIQPLGKHIGADVTQNMLVLCPNHHIMFDKGAITINMATLTVQHIDPTNEWHMKRIIMKHKISQQYIDYHDRHILKAKKEKDHEDIINIHQGNFGKVMKIVDMLTNEEIDIQFESYLQREFMTGIQRSALYQSIGEEFEFKGYLYKVVDIR